MTAFDRFDPFERRITETIDEIAATRAPEYLNDILRQTARTSQRPRWTFLERWLPMDTALSRPSFGRRIPMQQLLLVALIASLAVVAAAYLVGASRRDLPFGPAGNGLLAYSAGYDLYVDDQQSGPRLLATGVGFGPLWSRDGSKLATIRPILIRNHELGSMENGPNYCATSQPTCVDEIVVTDLSGRSVVVATLGHESWVIDWSPDGRTLLVETRDLDPANGLRMNVVLTPTDGSQAVPIGPMWRGFNALFTPNPAAPIVYLAPGETGQAVLRSADAQGLPLRDIATASVREGGTVAFDVSPDGAQIAFATDTSLQFLRPSGELIRALPWSSGFSWIRYSPDGNWLLADGERLLRATDSTSEPVALDRKLSGCEWAPDGNKLVCQDEASAVWLVDLATRTSRATTVSALESRWAPWISWQRVPTR